MYKKIEHYFKIIDDKRTSFLLIGKIRPEAISKIFRLSEGDLYVIAEELIKIGQIRDLIHWIHLKPLNSDYKVAVILDVDKMTIEASNALLKTLEEPPEHSILILTTLHEQKILPTIRSRCQKARIDWQVDFTKPAQYLDPNQIGQLSYKERFKWVAEVAESPEVVPILTLWQEYFRNKLIVGENVIGPLSGIERAKDLLEKNISVKLLLENLSLNF